MIRTIFFLLFATLTFANCTEEEYNEFKGNITDLASSPNGRWPGRLLRAAFHDCLPESCDGSLALELGRTENARIQVTINRLNDLRADTCVSLADALKLGLIVAMEVSGGPTITCPIGTSDATTPNQPDQLPGRADPVPAILSAFTSKGFTQNEALAGIIAGHSLGVDRGQLNLAFTPDIAVTDNAYADAMVDFANTGTVPTGFNVIASDRRLANRANLQSTISGYATDNSALMADYQAFLEKMCAM